MLTPYAKPLHPFVYWDDAFSKQELDWLQKKASNSNQPALVATDNDSGIDTNWHKSSVTVNFTCTDTNGSGCYKTYYTTDGTTPTVSSAIGNSATLNIDGIYTIKYFYKIIYIDIYHN